jgi:serine/threonine protein kinase/tetratricopeptide (TPR) repeat protein
MNRQPCPSTEDLQRLLDEQLEDSERTQISTHVDVCPHCQETLESLTRGHAYGLSVLSQNSFGEASGDSSSSTVDQTPPGPDATTDGGFSTSEHERPAATPSGNSPSIPAYEILDVIREGGMGVVYIARQRGLNRLVALKLIRGDRARPDHFARFRLEAEAVARLRHPNIVQIYEIDEAGGLPFLSLELLEGGTLEDRLAGNPQPARSSAELLATLARAVQFAHDEGIIHRDLKPSNVLFSGDGIPKITDFGLAKRIESDSRQTETGQIMGTPCYMAPEQARGHTRDVGPAADVYALGALLYEMLTGRPPFKGETPIETVRQVVEDDVVPPSRLVPRIARDLETICLHSLNKEPSRRYASALALAEDLESFLAGRPIKARRTPFWERGLKLARRHPVASTLLALALVATAGLTTAWLNYSTRETQRTNALRSSAFGDLLLSQSLLGQGQWHRAEPILTAVQAEIGGERDFADLKRRIGPLLEEAHQQRTEQANREAEREARSRDQERLQTFRGRRRDVLFRETRFAEIPYDPAAVAASARSTLAVFAAKDGADRWELAPLPVSLAADDHREIKEGCYELLLILAGSASSPELGLNLLDQAAGLAPPTRMIHLRRADCLARRGDGAAAASERKQAEALPIELPLDQFLIGKDLYQQGKWAEAIPHFDAVLLNQPGHFWSHYFSALCNLQRRQPVAAKADLTACLQAEPGLAWLHLLRGLASYQIATLARAAVGWVKPTGNIDRPSISDDSRAPGPLRTEIELQLQAAEKDYKRAFDLLEAAPNKDLHYALLVNRGWLWHERKAWDKAEADLQSAIRLDDRRWQAFETLAQVYQRQHRSDPAIAQFTRAIALRPEWAPLYRARAVVNLDRKDQTQAHRASALADLDQAIRLGPAGSPLLALDNASRAGILHREAREEEALAACDAALKVDRGNLDAHQLRIEVLRKLKRYDEIIRSCDALLARGKASPELYEFRALAKEKLRDYQGAIEDQTLAIALDPGNAAARARRGALYLVTDAPRSALRDFEKAIELDSANPDSHLGRGLALAALGQHRDAVAAASRALSIAEPTPTRFYNAARIHTEAAIAAASEARRSGLDAVSQVNRYQDQAMRLLGQWQNRLPAAERARALRDLLADPAMASLRRRLRILSGG